MNLRRQIALATSTAAALALAVALTGSAVAQPPLGSGELRIVGLRFVIDDASQTVPRNQATGLRNRFADPTNPSAALDAALLAGVADGLTLKGELSGPGF